MATVSSSTREPSGLGLLAAMTAKPQVVAFAVIAAVVFVRATGTVGPDVSWQLWIAHELNGGAGLYRDIIEANPPLWFWMAMPVDRLASVIHIRADHLLILIIGCFAALSLAATDRILASISNQGRTLLLTYAALVILAMPWLQFGQREQIVLIGTLPYAALIGARRSAVSVSTRLACLIGIGAGLSFALKHYFLLVPVLLELWLIAAERRKWRPFRAETLAIAGVGLLYAGTFAFFARDFFSVQLPLILLAYGVTGAERVVDLFQPAVLTGLATLALLIGCGRAVWSERSGFAGAMVVSAIGFATAYFIQAKGWSYHAVPLAGCAAIALAACLTADTKPRAVVLAAPALLLLPLWIGAQQALGEQRNADVERALTGLHRGDSVGFIATDPALAWPVTLQRGFVYPSRYYGFWMMRAVVNNEGAGAPDRRLAGLGRQVVADTVHDFRCLPPKRIIVARPSPEAAQSGDFDILNFFLRDPAFVRLIAHYRPVERTSVEVFALESPLEPAHDCPRRAQNDPTSTADPT